MRGTNNFLSSKYHTDLDDKEKDSELLYLGLISLLLIYGTNFGVELIQILGIYVIQLFLIGKTENE